MKIFFLFCLTGEILWGKCREVRVFPIFRSNYENNLDKKIVPRERPKFSRHYVQSSPKKISM